MSKSALVLALFIAWTLLLLVVMEAMRSHLVVTGRTRSNAFDPENSKLSPFMERTRTASRACRSLEVFSSSRSSPADLT